MAFIALINVLDAWNSFTLICVLTAQHLFNLFIKSFFFIFFSRNQAQIAYIICKDTKQDDGLNSQKMKCVDTLKIYSKQTS